MKRCSNSLRIRKMQIKTILKYHLIQIRLEKSVTACSVSKAVGNQTISYIEVVMQTGPALLTGNLTRKL